MCKCSGEVVEGRLDSMLVLNPGSFSMSFSTVTINVPVRVMRRQGFAKL